MPSASPRLDHLDAVRAFALLLGIVFHACLSFMPMFIGWAVMDVSTGMAVALFVMVSHSFRMEVFFLIAGFFGHMAYHRKGVGGFLKSRFVRIVVPFVVGWFLLRPLIVSGWIMGAASLRGEVDIAAGLLGGIQSLATLPADLFTGSHLWFLYYLSMVTLAVLGIRALIMASGSWSVGIRRGADAGVAWLAASRGSIPVLVLPTAALLWFMQGWGMDTPDRTLRPHVPVLLIYSGFFALGWMLHRHGALVSVLARLTITRGLVAAASIVACVMLVGLQADPGHPHFRLGRVGYLVSYATMMWMLVLLTIGVFQRLCRRPSAVVRYVADASYWLYLVHLPIVVWLQVAVAEWPLHWSIKIVGISAVTILVSLLTYDLLVRSTVVGQVLNGRRRERAIFTWARRSRAAVLAG